MNTRRANEGQPFRQERFASAPEFERGLLGNLVARRVATVEKKEDRELIWFIHYLSHKDGIPATVTELIKRNPDKFKDYEIGDFRPRPAQTELEKNIKKICLDPAFNFAGKPWPYPDIVPALRELREDYIKGKRPAFSTELGDKISDVLDYTAFSPGLTLIEGEARTGKSFGARAWCEQHPGTGRYVEVATGNDDVGFFRALARGLGLGNLLRYKACDIRDRVESVLLSGDLVLVLDEAQRLWPQRYLRQSFPGRVIWVMKMANDGVPIAMISTPQFIETQKAIEKHGWNSRQLTGRIKHYEPLPPEVSRDDLISVARSVLPEASAEALKALAIYAQNSARYLAAIDSIATRARYLAMKAGRSAATTADVRKAMQESVIPADSKLQSALAIGQSSRRARLTPSPAQSGNEFSTLRARSIMSAERISETPLVGV